MDECSDPDVSEG